MPSDSIVLSANKAGRLNTPIIYDVVISLYGTSEYLCDNVIPTLRQTLPRSCFYSMANNLQAI